PKVLDERPRLLLVELSVFPRLLAIVCGHCVPPGYLVEGYPLGHHCESASPHRPNIGDWQRLPVLLHLAEDSVQLRDDVVLGVVGIIIVLEPGVDVAVLVGPGALVDDLVVPLLQRLPLVAACPVAVVVDRHDDAVTVRVVAVHPLATVHLTERRRRSHPTGSLRSLVDRPSTRQP